ncbi:hypothetical protein F5I97DRAFT_1923502 [Phlebopus sp. FC_14]|nr:hypothetical protein F5I97DRAFT_1923502 [Phlebopus sp. FC_14]
MTEVVSGPCNSVPKWSFVKISAKRDDGPAAHNDSTVNAQPFAGIPRAWTNSRDELLRVFPELGQGPSGLSWLQSETPVLLLDHCRPEDIWTGPTTVTLTTMWNFSCELSALECSDSPMVSGSENSTDLYPHAYPTQEAESRAAVASTGVETNLQRASRSSESEGAPAAMSSPTTAANNGFDQMSDGPFVFPAELFDSTNNQDSNSTVPPVPLPKPNIPPVKPEEIHTLLDSHAYLVPVLIWSSRECRLTPTTPSAEYAYSCLGFFFISDLREDVIDYTTNTATQTVRGRVRWYVDLEWAPGGEEFLLDETVHDNFSSDVDGQVQLTSREDLAHPWWLDTPGEEGTHHAIEVPPQYRPRELRMHYYSYLPLDLLADFHPSESFPRGWFCTKCGMINAQKLFRHQICQSSACKSDEPSRRGKVDPLSKLRTLHHVLKLVHPVNNAPPFLDHEQGSWDDKMQYWSYLIKDNVSVQHVFTGNEDFLQVEATKLLEDIQRDVLLKREDPSSPYFIHVTAITNSIDPPRTQVPIDTPSCIRSAYHFLVDRAERYGEIDKPSFNRVTVQAWVSTGSKKGRVFHAKTSPVVVVCLGAEVVLNIVPKAGYGPMTTVGDTVINADEGEDVHPAEITPECPKDVTSRPSAIPSEQSAGPSHQDGDIATSINQPSHQKGSGIDPDAESRPDLVISTAPPYHAAGISASVEKSASASKRGRGRKAGKAEQKGKRTHPEISMTLVHGDSAILKGDDFECQIVRTGTTILVIGSETS